MKLVEKEKAIALRQKGLTYSEVLKEVPVAKSTLSIWLRSVGLSKPEKQRITEKRLAAGLRGGEARRRQRILLTQKIQEQAKKDIRKISKRDLWLMGVMLYWAEGTKERNRIGSGLQFSNSDPEMINFFLMWLKEICKIPNESLNLSIYIHENSKNRIGNVVKHWSNIIGLPKDYFTKVYYKRHNIKTNRKNIGESYYGLLAIKVRSSSRLNRQIAGWIKGVIECLEVHPG